VLRVALGDMEKLLGRIHLICVCLVQLEHTTQWTPYPIVPNVVLEHSTLPQVVLQQLHVNSVHWALLMMLLEQVPVIAVLQDSVHLEV